MALFIASLLALLCVIAVVYPFLRRAASEPAIDDGDAGGDGSAELESALESIRALQLERQLGRITEETYREQLRDYRMEAARLLRQREKSPAPEQAPNCAECGGAMPEGAAACPSCGQGSAGC